jgi:hypothetical protein
MKLYDGRQASRDSNIVEMIENGFSEFEGNNGAKIACGNISSQALSACLAESQF